MTGSMATAIATLAIAVLGFLMFSGRFDWRRSAATIMGCFLIFGAPIIAGGLMGAASTNMIAKRQVSEEPLVTPPTPRAPQHYDPYAGAALPPGW
ncbi:hypothetical protein SBA_ch1_06070 [Sphingomonas bisphenolicum]|uniref:TrbC/VIRB2 family protein n=2 Tax=Sphingomonas bisphenolicum TaxID=296544 RepID=A0ABM7FXL3_9SPHN|nr:hypothetical protein SBA_ch1_06070 [Sphingomonas bisphenolicum]